MKRPHEFAFLLLALCLAISTTARAGVYDVFPSGAEDYLWDDLINDMNTLYDERETVVQDSLQSLAALQARQAQLQSDFRSLVGYVPETKTDLNAQVTGTVNVTGQNYKIEKIIYESRPGHHVTANLYLPLSASAENPVPGVLVACGHATADSKASEAYQSACILMAQNGMAALIFDPGGQGERAQIYSDPKGTTEHTMMGVGARTLGMNMATYEIWDGVRSLDYLLSRSEIDTTKVGMAGNSGGGTQTAWMMAYDERIDVATPSCFISTMKDTVLAIGPQDCEQHFAGQANLYIEHADLLTMRAPKPTRILAAQQDFFPIAGTQTTYAEAQDVYSLMGDANAVDLFTYNDTHGWSEPRREASVQWFKQYFFGDSSAVSEPASQPIQSVATLRCTTTGQVTNDYVDEKTMIDFTLERAAELQPERESYWATHTDAECRAMVNSYLNVPADRGVPSVGTVGTIDRTGYTIEKLSIQRGSDEVPLSALLFIPDNVTSDLPATVYIDGSGKATQAGVGGDVESLVNSGQIVISVDISGYGETADTSSRNVQYNNEECNSSYLAQYVGDSLVGRRTEDIMLSVDILLDQNYVDDSQINLIGVGKASTAVMHAAALDTRIAHVELEDPFVTSWIDDVVSKPLNSDLLGHVVPGALNQYDLPDLQRLMPNSVVVEESLVKTLYRWRFDGNLDEESGTFDGTAIGNASAGTANGAFAGSGAVYFDGVDDAVSIDQEVLDGGSFSIVFWAKAATGTTGYFLSDSANNSNLFARRFDNGGDSQLSGWIDGINFGNIGDEGYEDGSWAFVVWNQHVIIYNEETCKQEWYVNGELIRQVTPDDFAGLQSDLYLGNRADLLRDFKGWIDDLQIYNWALDEDQVETLYNSPGTVAPLGVPGDANQDGVVDASDATILAGNWQAHSATWAMGDFNGDGVVNASDATILAGNWQYGTSANTVPEPSTILLLLVGVGSLLMIRCCR
ncbi:MAG: acetylxylan esterase [Planctomycetia bacterium]|jgi:cephalosporin-C deacetylase-like acetyl esterase